MIRGTTPTHCFNMNIESSRISSLMVIYAQSGTELFRKSKRDGTLEEGVFRVRLTQEETLKFDHERDVEIQVRALTKDGTALASRIYVIPVGQCLNSEVLV